MVADPPEKTSRGLNDLDELRSGFYAWIRPLQQALTIEAEKGFKDIQGRQEYFHDFVVRELGGLPSSFSISKETRCRLNQ